MIETRTKSPNNVGTFATEDIEEGTIILRECPLFPGMKENHLKFHLNPNPTGDAEVDAEIQALQRVVRMQATIHQGAMLRGSESFNSLFPPVAREALDKLNVYADHYEFNLQPVSVQKKWLSLHDAFQDVPTGMKSIVGIFGLKSEKGKLLNGTIGTTLGEKGTGTNEGRISVRTVRKNEMGDMINESLWIKAENIKTVYGTKRSNKFENGLFENISRINHSCCPNTIMTTVEKILEGCKEVNSSLPVGLRIARSKPNEHAIIPDPDWEIHAGDELTLSYLGERNKSRSTEMRRETLLEKYGFTCQCEACKKNEFC